MNKVIWKYTVERWGYFEHYMPRGAQILQLQLQGDVPRMWVLVDQEEEKVEKRAFVVVGTGSLLSDHIKGYIGTFQRCLGHVVHHLFEIEPRQRGGTG